MGVVLPHAHGGDATRTSRWCWLDESQWGTADASGRWLVSRRDEGRPPPVSTAPNWGVSPFPESRVTISHLVLWTASWNRLGSKS